MVFRSFSIPGNTGSFTNDSNPPTTVNRTGYGIRGNQDTAVNTPYTDNTWRASYSTIMGGYSTGQYINSSGVVKGTLKDYPLSTSPLHYASYPPVPYSGPGVSRAIASMHPGKGDVELPVFLFELKDVPSMMKHAYKRAKQLEDAAGGRGLQKVRKYLRNPKNPAQDWLNWNFGWKPLLSDLKDLADLCEYAKRRQDRFQSTTQRERSLGESKSNGKASGGLAYFSEGSISHVGDGLTVGTRESWIFSKWINLEYQAYAAFGLDYSRAIRQSLGLDMGIHHVWNAIPYTWLVDWFTATGSVIDAYANRFGWIFKNAQIMTHSRLETTITPRPWGSSKSTTPSSPVYMKVSDEKLRSHAVPGLPPGLSMDAFFDAGKLATLASLAVTKGGGGVSHTN